MMYEIAIMHGTCGEMSDSADSADSDRRALLAEEFCTDPA